MIVYAAGYVSSLVVFLFLDFLWLGVVARDFYQSRLAMVIDMHVSWPLAGLFYALHIAGVVFFVITPAMTDGHSVAWVLMRGALYGFFTYATYDLTNLATVRNWPVMLAVVDMLWGAFLNAAVALAGIAVMRGVSGS